MMGKEEFIQSFLDTAKQNISDADIEVAVKLAGQIWTGHAIMREVVLDDDFKTSAHRYYHGVGHARANTLLMLPLGQAALSILIEHMFAVGFMCGVAHERGWNIDEVASAAEAAACLEKQGDFLPALRTREEIDQDEALPSIIGTAEGILPEGFGAPPDIENGGDYF